VLATISGTSGGMCASCRRGDTSLLVISKPTQPGFLLLR